MFHAPIQILQAPARHERAVQRKAKALFDRFERDGCVFYEVPRPRARKVMREYHLPIPDVISYFERLAYEQNREVQSVDNVRDNHTLILDNALMALSQWAIDWRINDIAVREFDLEMLDAGTTYSATPRSSLIWIYTRYTEQFIQCLIMPGESTLIQGELLGYTTTEFCKWLMIDEDKDYYPSNIERTEEWDFTFNCTASVQHPFLQESATPILRSLPGDFVTEMEQVVSETDSDFQEGIKVKFRVGFEGTVVEARRAPIGYSVWQTSP